MLPKLGTRMDALHALTEHLFDYAGMFPPAAKSLEGALEETIHFPSSLQRPDLVAGDLVCSCEELANLKALLPSWIESRGRPLHLCLLMSSVDDEDEWKKACEAIKGESITLRTVECKVTLECVDTERVIRWSNECRFKGTVALEPNPLPDLDSLHRFARELKAANERVGRTLFALKVRGNAVERDMLATIIAICAEAELPLKLTQLLHHPIIEPARYGNHLGFLTVSLAWNLAARTSITPVELQECLGISKVEDLRFEGEFVSWRSYSLHAGEIRATRERCPLSIGSCSISEPDEDLKRLFR